MNLYPCATRVSLLFLSVFLISGCNESTAPDAESSIPHVKTTRVTPRPFEMTAELPGRIEPVRIAQVRARITGIVLKRNFVEGADVQAGQVLFEIDPAPFKADLAKAKGGLSDADARLYEAQSLVKRYQPLVKKDLVSQQAFDQAMSAYKSALAMKESARASLETAKINLGYATVRAPISGRIGRAQVTEGALVSQNDSSSMATIQQLDTVYADFQQSVSQVLAIRKAVSVGKLQKTDDKSLPVYISAEGDNEQHRGTLLFTDITVDRETGQVSLRGIFPNKDDLLLPGMYVRVRLGQGIDPKAVLIPQRAVHRDLDGKASVYIVRDDRTVEQRYITTGKMYGSEWHILEGLNSGDEIVISGAAVEGQKVVPEPYRQDIASNKTGNGQSSRSL
ncbi:efflux RND transporter periplasmic adaptor subunit [Erwinia sp. P6884]|uniref:efflux RND transporter periplasmic adaptor subunit n=1 Tax=Erwinia sp. P6884 TaxID=3141450 RepID=UPI00318EFBDD